MKAKLFLLSAAVFMMHAGTAFADDQTITFHVPMNLQNIHPDVKTVWVSCRVMSSSKSHLVVDAKEVPITNRKFIGTVSIPVKVAHNQVESADNWECGFTLAYYGNSFNPQQGSGPDHAQAKVGTPFVPYVNGKIQKGPLSIQQKSVTPAKVMKLP